jgi:hypothetical protein
VKEPKIRMGDTRQNLQAQPKMLKKIVGASTANQNKKNPKKRVKIFPKKVCLVPCEKEPKIRMGATRQKSPRDP